MHGSQPEILLDGEPSLRKVSRRRWRKPQEPEPGQKREEGVRVQQRERGRGGTTAEAGRLRPMPDHPIEWKPGQMLCRPSDSLCGSQSL